VRKLAWIALAGQVLFVVSWIVGGALQPGYSHIEQGVSELGAHGAAHPWLANAGIAVFGLSLAAIGVAVFPLLPARRASRVALALFVGAAAAIVSVALIRLDCPLSDQRCEDMWRAGQLSWHESGHLWASMIGQLLLAGTPFAIARALSPGPVAALAFAAGVTGVAIGLGTFLLYAIDDSPGGLIQRFGFLVVFTWVAILAAGVLHSTRRSPAPGRLVPLRPRDFFAAEWTGTGELVARPFFLWRHWARPFESHRSATFISDKLVRFDDEAHFGPGRSVRRRTYCEFVSDDRIVVTAGDLPEGASVQVEEDGYRVTPFRMDFPVGPVGIPIRVHDVSSVEPDGTLLNTFEARSLVFGLRLARLTFRVRPVVRASADGPPR
jgi:hypothetical protein